MIDGKRIVAWTPYGRRATVEVLQAYLRRDHAIGIVDEWWLCMNTGPDQDGDIVYAHDLEAAHEFIHIKERPTECPALYPIQRNTGYFYRYMTDPDTIYIRLDDDIVYIHPAAIARLARARMQQDVTTICSALIWNNAICTHFLQNQPVPGDPTKTTVPREWGEVRLFCMDANGWANGEFAVKLHGLLLDRLEADEPVDDLFLYQDYMIPVGTQFSVSCFASSGTLYAGLPHGPGVLSPDEEESWHTIYRPAQVGAPNVIIGNALVSHYSFGPQHGVLYPSNVLAPVPGAG
jgi:hypothetical protein